MATIYHRLFIAAGAGEIYAALTTQAGLCAWWTPDATAVAREGAVARFGFDKGYFKEMIVKRLDNERHVEWACIAGADEWVGTTISFGLEAGDKKMLQKIHPELTDQLQQANEANEGTVIIFRHEGWKTLTPMFAECSYTWAQFLESLKLYCETGKGKPWPGQHRSCC